MPDDDTAAFVASAPDPRHASPQLCNLYDARRGPGESLRVFPLSDKKREGYF